MHNSDARQTDTATTTDATEKSVLEELNDEKLSNAAGSSVRDRSTTPGDSARIKAEKDGSLKRTLEDVDAEAKEKVVETIEPKDGQAKEAGKAEATEEEDESKYLTGWKLTALSIGLCLTTFVIALDNTIIATAIPRITTVFNSLEDVGWYGSSYLLTTCALLPSFGKIYTYFDVKWVYLFALLLFEVGSVICAAAQNSVTFIVGRAVAGSGAAALFSGGMTIVGYSVALRKRAIYIAALSSMFGIASVVGPILGGAFTDNVSWRWCFWINLPFGGLSFVAILFFFQNPERQYSHISLKKRMKEVDLLGALFLICAIVCLLLALQWGGLTYAWGNSKVWGNLLGFGLIISVFIAIQLRTGDRATIPYRVFTQRTVLFSCLFTAFLSMALYTHIFYLPFYFQAAKGTSAEESGIRTIAYLVSMTIASIVVGGAITGIGYYSPFMWVGSAIFTIGSGMLYTLEADSSAGYWIGYQILAGLGAGCCVQIPFIAVQVVTSEKDMPVANAMVTFFNSLGGAISISVAQNIFINSLQREIPKYAPDLDPKVVIGAGATHVKQVVPPESLHGVLEAYTKAIVSAFILAIATGGIAFFLSLRMEWKSVKGKKLLGGGAA